MVAEKEKYEARKFDLLALNKLKIWWNERKMRKRDSLRCLDSDILSQTLNDDVTAPADGGRNGDLLPDQTKVAIVDNQEQAAPVDGQENASPIHGQSSSSFHPIQKQHSRPPNSLTLPLDFSALWNFLTTQASSYSKYHASSLTT